MPDWEENHFQRKLSKERQLGREYRSWFMQFSVIILIDMGMNFDNYEFTNKNGSSNYFCIVSGESTKS